jgi:DNA-binding transcriptional regulator/RsmH inhibitor MraZ
MDSERILSAKVMAGQRIRIPKKFTQGIEWLADQRKDVLAKAIVGEEGGIQIAPAFKIHQRIQSVSAQKIDEETGAANVALGRYLDSTHEVKFEHEQSRFTLVFPKFFRDIKILPSRIKNQEEDPKVVLWSRGSFLEIWEATEWAKHVRSIASKIDAFVEDAEQE